MHKLKKESLKVLSKSKRILANTFIKNYELKKISSRSGECKKCGKCCKGCKYLDKKTKLCKIYEKRPTLCFKNFPLSEKDQKIWGIEKTCGYAFEK